jgi:hypothetical protein
MTLEHLVRVENHHIGVTRGSVVLPEVDMPALVHNHVVNKNCAVFIGGVCGSETIQYLMPESPAIRDKPFPTGKCRPIDGAYCLVPTSSKALQQDEEREDLKRQTTHWLSSSQARFDCRSCLI